jgi:DNA-binding transcriptional ArsR family regulator
MSLVASHPGGEACVCDQTGAFDLSQPTISHHLKVLHDSGLLDREKRGVWVYYRARTQALGQPRHADRFPAGLTAASAAHRDCWRDVILIERRSSTVAVG